MKKLNKVYKCDCMDFMLEQKDCIRIMGREFPFSYVLAIVDPPYGIGWTKTLLQKQKTEKAKQNSIKHGYKIHKVSDYDIRPPGKEYFNEIIRISINQIIWGGNYFTDKLACARCWIIWDKMSSFSSVNPEMAWTNFDKPVAIFKRADGLDKGFLNQEGGHIQPNQKPVALYKWLLTNYAKPGQLILDTHVGSGSIRIACHDLGFDFVGCELDPDYWRGQEERYREHIAQQSLISTEEIQQLIYTQGEL